MNFATSPEQVDPTGLSHRGPKDLFNDWRTTMHRLGFLALMMFGCWFGSVSIAQAVDLNGIWASDVSVCKKVFVKNGTKISFSKNADLYGSGFIIEKDRIRGPIATCNIKSRKEVGETIHLIAACATDIMLSSVPFSVKVMDDNTIARIYPDIPEMSTTYYRCSL
jgi:hypothetical protein